MKKITLIALILIALSCTKEEDGPPKTYAILKMNVNGQELSGDQLFHGKYLDNFTLTFLDRSTLDITGVEFYGREKYSTNNSSLSFLWVKKTGEYEIIDSTSGDAGLINGKLQGNGNIRILEITSSHIRGTFECIAPADSNRAVLPPIVITEGAFHLRRRS